MAAPYDKPRALYEASKQHLDGSVSSNSRYAGYGEAFPLDTAPRYLLRDGDSIFGERVRRRIDSLGIGEVVTAPAFPWKNPYVGRVIGSLRRELLDHVIILNERHFKRLLSSYLGYYHSL